MKRLGRAWTRTVGLCLLLGLSGGAWAQTLPKPPEPLTGRPPHGPRPPTPPQTLTLQQARALVQRAAQIVPELRAGDPRWRPQPGTRSGTRRPAVPLSYQGAVVAFAFLTPQGNLAELAGGSAPPGSPNPDTLPLASSDLPAQLARLNVSGLVRLTGPHTRISLILDGRAVAQLDFDRQGRLVPAPEGKPVPSGKKGPGRKGP